MINGVLYESLERFSILTENGMSEKNALLEINKQFGFEEMILIQRVYCNE